MLKGVSCDNPHFFFVFSAMALSKRLSTIMASIQAEKGMQEDN